MLSSPIQEIQISIDGAKKLKALGEALDRLRRNKDFKLVVELGYLEDEALRLTGCLSEVTDTINAPAAIGGMSKEKIVSQLQGIAHFSAYLREVERKTSGIHESLLAYEQELELRRQEEAGV